MPYNPGVSDVSGQLIGRGIGHGLASLADAIKDKQEEDKQEAQRTKRNRSILKALQPELGLSDTDVENVDADTAEGILEGHFFNQKTQRHKAELGALSDRGELVDAQLQNYGRLQSEYQYTLEQREAMDRLQNRLAAMPGRPDPDTLAQMAAAEGVDPNHQQSMYQNMALMARTDPYQQDMTPTVSNIDGVKVVHGPRGQFQVVDQPQDLVGKPIPGAPDHVNIGGHPYKRYNQSGLDPDVVAAKRNTLGKLKAEVSQLKALQKKGQTHATVNQSGDVMLPAWYRNDDPIEDLLTTREAQIKAMEEELKLEEEPTQGPKKYRYDPGKGLVPK